MKRTAIVFALFIFASCGGGGGGGLPFAGVWEGTLYLVESQCSETVSDAFPYRLTINESPESIVVDSGNFTYQGPRIDDSGFTVTNQREDQCYYIETGEIAEGSTSVAVRTFQFSEVSGDLATVKYTYDDTNCSGNTFYDSSCHAVWEGKLERTMK